MLQIIKNKFLSYIRTDIKQSVKYSFLPLPCPDILPIQITNKCNARCVFCQYPYNIDNKITMSFELFRNIVDDFKSMGGAIVHLIGAAGEVYCDDGIIDKLLYLQKIGITSYITTNGTLFHKNNFATRTIDAGPRRIFISTPGFSANSYQNIFNVSNYNEFFPGLIELITYNKSKHSAANIVIGFRSNESEDKILNFEDHVNYIKPFVNDGSISIEDSRYQFDSWARTIKNTDNIQFEISDFYETKKLCAKLYTPQLAVLSNGNLKLCGCSYIKTEIDSMVIGDLKRESISDALNSRKVKSIFIDFITKKYIPDICIKCTRPEFRRT